MNRFSPISAVRHARTRPRSYWAFLSYAHADEKAAAKLHRALEQYRVPPALVGDLRENGPIPPRLVPVFRDRQELAASSDLGRTIADALAASRFLIVLCSPAAAGSRWVDQEIREFKALHGEERVLAAILHGEPFAADPEEECFPPALRQRIGRDGQPTGEPAEPIAADLRDRADGWHGGMLKLIAGMLEVGLDDLVQRDQQRRQRRLMAVTGSSVVGMAAAIGLALVAINSRDAAREERAQAESLVEFMLGDLRGELEPIGRLDALDKVGERALGYYARQDEKSLDDDQLAQRSKALTLLGQIAFSRGQTGAARERYREAMRGTRELVERYPGDPEKLFEHAQNLFWMGELDRERGQMDKAEAAYREYARLAARMVAAEPTNPRWQMETLYARENIGIVESNQRRFAEAAASFQATVGPLERLARSDPTNPTYRGELGMVLAWLGDARRDEGKLEAAIEARRRQIALLRDWLAESQTNVQLQQQLIPAQQALGRLYTDVGRSAAGVEQLRRAVADTRALIAIEPSNATWKSFGASAQLELARTLILSRRLTLAAPEIEAGCALADEFRAMAPTASQGRSLTTACNENRARLLVGRGDVAGALPFARRAVDSARQERSGDPVGDRFSVAGAYLLLGDIQLRRGDRQSAEKAWKAGLDVLPTAGAERPRELSERAELYRRAGRQREASALAERLRSIGFRPSY